MSLSIGIVGLPNIGKSTLFKALTKKQIDIQNYPFTTIDPNVGIVLVPDNRLDLLAKLSKSKKIIPTYIKFIDIAGLVKGAADGEGLGNKFLSNIREVDAIAHVVRVFQNPHITHVHNAIDPVHDIEIIHTELILADLETVQKRYAKTKKQDPLFALESSLLNRLESHLQSGQLANTLNVDDKEQVLLDELHLLTAKKMLYVFNASEEQIKNKWQPDEKLTKVIGPTPYTVLSSTFELILSESSPEEQNIFLSDLDLKTSGLDQLITRSYELLGLITFLTTGEDETRAWTSHKDALIPKAASAIHTDFEKLFIKAEVINWQDLVTIGSWGQARQQGKITTVGKDYVIRDGDVVEIKI